jgi:multimeric flavodoxin WrbA
MKAVILNGANQGDSGLIRIQKIICDELNALDWESEPFLLRDITIAACQGDFGCWLKTPGICIIKDSGRDIAGEAINSDMVILLSPVTFGGYSAELKKALDRIICLMSPFFMKINGEFHHKKRYRRYPGLIGVGVLEKPDEESRQIFKTLVNRNAVNFHAPYEAAEVLLIDEEFDSMKAKIRKLLSTAEVNS